MNRYIALQKIIELGSFTKAAESLGYTQSSISQMIASLENELSIKLLTRSRYGVKLTIEGADLYPFIERSIYQYRFYFIREIIRLYRNGLRQDRLILALLIQMRIQI